jgi:two-component system NarL family response regulator
LKEYAMRILLVDDHILFREGLISLLADINRFTLVGVASSTSEALVKIQELQPELVLLDLALEAGNGLDTLAKIVAESPETDVIILTLQYSDELLIASLRLGAKGYLLKNDPFSSLISSLDAVERGEVAVSRMMTRRIIDELSGQPSKQTIDHSTLKCLTQRELQVLELLCAGATNREIGSRLVITEYTVKNHVRNILKKLQIKNRREAAKLAKKNGLFNK